MNFLNFLLNYEKNNPTNHIIFDGKFFRTTSDYAIIYIVDHDGEITDNQGKLTGFKIDLIRVDNNYAGEILERGNPTGFRLQVRDEIVSVISQQEFSRLTKDKKVNGYLDRIGKAIIALVVCAVVFLIAIFAIKVYNGEYDVPYLSSWFGSKSNYNGTYYKYSGSQLDKSVYFELKSGKWTDNDGYSGKYEVSGNEITLYVGDIPFFNGTIKDGKLEIQITSYSTSVYYKDGYQP